MIILNNVASNHITYDYEIPHLLDKVEKKGWKIFCFYIRQMTFTKPLPCQYLLEKKKRQMKKNKQETPETK